MNGAIETPSTVLGTDVRAYNKEIVFTALANAGICRITVDYDGSCDSGQIEGIAAFDADRNDLPQPDCKVQLVPSTPDNTPVEMTLQAFQQVLRERRSSR